MVVVALLRYAQKPHLRVLEKGALSDSLRVYKRDLLFLAILDWWSPRTPTSPEQLLRKQPLPHVLENALSGRDPWAPDISHL